MYKLVIEDDEGGKTPVNLIRDEITIGRKEGNTIRLTERNVSRRHARIVREDDKVYIEDVAARYGIKKNGKKIDHRAELKEGDVVLIGDYRLTLKSDAPKARAPGKADPSEATKITSLDELSGGDWAGDVRESTQIMQTLPAKLVVISSNFAGEEFPLHQREMVIGRDSSCHIIIDHRSISGTHAKIIREDNTTYKIVDLNSKNGIKVSGESYRATHLKRGDVVELGHVKFRFVEPGENYVFTPQASADAVAPAPMAPAGAAGGGGKTGLIIGGLAIVAVIALALIFIPRDSSEDTATGDASTTAPVAHSSGGTDSDRVASMLSTAREQMAEGRMNRAIGTLEILESLDATGEQREEIQELLRTARNELPFQRHYENALEDLDDGDFVRALDRVSNIPSHSLFHNRLREEGAYDDILGGVIDLGRDALEEGELDEAESMAEEVLLAESGYEPAETLLAEIAAERDRRVAAAQRPTVRDTGGSRPDRGGGRPAQPTVTPEEAQELFRSAARKVTSGNAAGAIEDCQRALRGSHTPCHRILGLAYANTGQTSQACTHFRRYLASGPSNPAAIEAQMDRIGCD